MSLAIWIAFQHTATRRWLHREWMPKYKALYVSTHSHPKVAAIPRIQQLSVSVQFQHTATRRWLHDLIVSQCEATVFQHTAARRRLPTQANYVLGLKKFQHTAARRRLREISLLTISAWPFQHSATRRWLPRLLINLMAGCAFQHSATRRWLLVQGHFFQFAWLVSTLSHPKVAALALLPLFLSYRCFNTQPPEGSCVPMLSAHTLCTGFNTQPPEGSCCPPCGGLCCYAVVSTHSHPKVAAVMRSINSLTVFSVSTHSHPKVAANQYQRDVTKWLVSTHSHPKVAASLDFRRCCLTVFQHTATRR